MPGVRYSSFQFTAYERNKNLEQRYGKGAVRIYENLVAQAQKEVDRENLEKSKRYKTRFGSTIVVDEFGNTTDSVLRDYKAE